MGTGSRDKRETQVRERKEERDEKMREKREKWGISSMRGGWGKLEILGTLFL